MLCCFLCDVCSVVCVLYWCEVFGVLFVVWLVCLVDLYYCMFVFFVG